MENLLINWGAKWVPNHPTHAFGPTRLFELALYTTVQCMDPTSTPNFLGTLHFHKDMAAKKRSQQNIRQSKGIISSS